MQSEAGIARPPENVTVTELTSRVDYERLRGLGAERGSSDPRHGYRIGPDDLLEVRIPDLLENGSRSLTDGAAGVVLPTVRETPLFQQGVRVTSHGTITLPLLGEFKAEGLTSTELEAEIGARLKRADILRKPQVTVQLAEYRSGVVAVMGSVEKPGLYPITRPGATIADLIWAAGGPAKDAGRIVAFAPVGSPDPIRIDLDMLTQPDGADAAVINVRAWPGDVISLAPAGSVMVDGWVEKPGAYPVTRGMTLIGAVAAAGGHHFAADRQHAMVKRSLGPRESKVITVDLDKVARGEEPDFPLTDGDLVRLPPSPTRMVPWTMYKVTTSMIAIGASIPIF
jgi:polysaccharide export outer membrane protein